MGANDRLRRRTEKGLGKAREWLATATGGAALKVRGRKDTRRDDLKEAGRKLKDALRIHR
jgi:uncharacterized protein YjbJ (UPF0337 family)